MATVNDVMTAHAYTCPASAMVVDAAKRMRAHEIGDVVVVDDEGKICGIVTDRDIVVRVLAEDRDPHSTTVGDVCSRDPVTVSSDVDAEEAAQLMRRRGVRRLPVVDDGRIVGILSLRDLAGEHVSGSSGDAGPKPAGSP